MTPYLTDREREVLLLVADGFSNAEVGDVLGICKSTVSNHLHTVALRLGSKGRANTIWLAVRYGLLNPYTGVVA